MRTSWPRVLVFLAVLSCITSGSLIASVSEDPEPIGVGDDPDPVDPTKALMISEDPEPFRTGVISDAPDPISGYTGPGAMAVDDDPDPMSGVINDDPDPFLCIIDGPEPVGALIGGEPRIVHPVVCRIGQTAVVIVWVAR